VSQVRLHLRLPARVRAPIARFSEPKVARYDYPHRGTSRADSGPAGINNGRVSDDLLSRAVVIYVWGLSGHPWPSRDTEAVSQALGEQTLDLLPRIEAI
jgi:hypothetical protein